MEVEEGEKRLMGAFAVERGGRGTGVDFDIRLITHTTVPWHLFYFFTFLARRTRYIAFLYPT